METNISKTNSVKSLFPKILQTGIKINISEEYFKDYVNVYFRNKKTIKKIHAFWQEKEFLQLKFDDRLNMFFLYKEYNPVLGFYYYKETVQLVPFNNNKLFLAIAFLIDFVDQIKERKIEANKEQGNTGKKKTS